MRLIDNYRDWKNNQLDGDVVFSPTPDHFAHGHLRLEEPEPRAPVHLADEDSGSTATSIWSRGLYYFHEKYHQGEQLQHELAILQRRSSPASPAEPTLQRVPDRGGTRWINATVQDVYPDGRQLRRLRAGQLPLHRPVLRDAGGRYTQGQEGRVRTSRRPIAFLANVRAPEALTFPDFDDSRFTYRLGLNYEPTKDHLFFATYSTGYKSAGYNSGAGSPSLTTRRRGVVPPERRVFDRETTEDWELGAKTSWLDHKLTLNLTFYRMDISGFQDRAFDGTSFTVRNAGNLRHQGFEFDGVARPLRELSLFANVAYLDSEFTDYPNAPDFRAVRLGSGPRLQLGSTQDLKGKPATFAPSGADAWASTGPAISVRAAGPGTSTRTCPSSRSNMAASVNDANPQTIIDGYALLGARASVNWPDDRWTVSLFGNNLLNKQYGPANLYQFLGGPLGLRNGVFPGSTAVRRLHADPRTIGASVTVHY